MSNRLDKLSATPQEKLRTLMQMVFVEELTGNDQAIRNWALGEPEIRLRVQRTDQFRLNHTIILFTECGFAQEAAEFRAGIFVSQASREGEIFGRLNRRDRVRRAELFFDLLVGQDSSVEASFLERYQHEEARMKAKTLNLVLLIISCMFTTPAMAAGGTVISPTSPAPDRYVYYPGTEELAKDEIRLIACGTGMPAARRDQAATCWLAELGNGDKFLFDVGTGSMANVAALMIPYDFLDKVFLTHLHTDHWGDLTTLWAGGWTAGRTKPLQVWGPSGNTEDMGTAYAIDHFMKAFKWDAATRNAKLSPTPGMIKVHEFDYRAVNGPVYEANGATIRSIPAIHAGDGPVSFILEYAGLKVVVGGDTFPNKWFIQHAGNADVAIHEVFMTPADLVKFYGQSPGQALGVGTQVHTSPPAFGKVMSTIQPRHAIGYHFFNESGTHDDIFRGVRSTYDGPLTLATDDMVWNITKDTIEVRDIVSPDQAWSVNGPNKPPAPPAPGTVPDPMTDFIKQGRWEPAQEAQASMVNAFRKAHNMK